MSLTFLKSAALGLSAAGLISLVGCSDVSQKDVRAAREDAREEQQDVEEARQNAAEETREERQETAEVRREALRPNYDEDAAKNIREEEQETKEASKEGAEAVAEEQKEATEAKQEANKTEARFNAQKARDAYVSDAERQLKMADNTLDTMKEKADSQEGAAKDATQAKIDLIETRRDAVEDAIDKVKSADALKWQTARDDVERTLKDLSQAMTTTE